MLGDEPSTRDVVVVALHIRAHRRAEATPASQLAMELGLGHQW